VLLVVVLWVWPDIGATAEPRMAIAAPDKNNVFIVIISFQPIKSELVKINRYVSSVRTLKLLQNTSL
jgi:hypothetical protein